MHEVNSLFDEIATSLMVCRYALETNNPVLFADHIDKLRVYRHALNGVKQAISGNYEVAGDSTIH